MISYLRGMVYEHDGGAVIIDVNGVGYEVFVTGSLASYLLSSDGEVELYIHTHFSDSGATLYGFLYRDELAVFKSLITVSGIGPKGAMSILSTFSVRDLFLRVAADDSKSISRAPGIGAKTAQKLVIELKDKFRMMMALHKEIEPDLVDETENHEETRYDMIRAEATEALMTLGFSKQEVKASIGKVEIDDSMTVEMLIKEALKARKSI
ncbi:MAG: Holliday junction branch migration protein RuvA [Lachnospiraceae bacterium]|nr:Holliday junction branch migration protein RuvA [Lachnospiraceae bacterium]